MYCKRCQKRAAGVLGHGPVCRCSEPDFVTEIEFEEYLRSLYDKRRGGRWPSAEEEYEENPRRRRPAVRKHLRGGRPDIARLEDLVYDRLRQWYDEVHETFNDPELSALLEDLDNIRGEMVRALMGR